MYDPVSAVDAAMARLRAAERERRAAIEDLIRLGAIRSHVVVGDLAPTRPRTIIGEINDPCDVVLAIRLDRQARRTSSGAIRHG
jgi:hypothetical protein